MLLDTIPKPLPALKWGTYLPGTATFFACLRVAGARSPIVEGERTKATDFDLDFPPLTLPQSLPVSLQRPIQHHSARVEGNAGPVRQSIRIESSSNFTLALHDCSWCSREAWASVNLLSKPTLTAHITEHRNAIAQEESGSAVEFDSPELCIVPACCRFAVEQPLFPQQNQRPVFLNARLIGFPCLFCKLLIVVSRRDWIAPSPSVT